MGTGTSKPKSTDKTNSPVMTPGLQSIPLVNRIGYQIMSVAEGSPAHQSGLQPYFDYIFEVGGLPVDPNGETSKVCNIYNRSIVYIFILYRTATV